MGVVAHASNMIHPQVMEFLHFTHFKAILLPPSHTIKRHRVLVLILWPPAYTIKRCEVLAPHFMAILSHNKEAMGVCNYKQWLIMLIIAPKCFDNILMCHHFLTTDNASFMFVKTMILSNNYLETRNSKTIISDR